MSMTILALDLATKTGWAVAQDGRIVESGVQDFALRRGESHGLMFLRARRWCLDTARTAGAGLLAYEQAHYRGGAATEVCVGLVTHAMGAAAELGIESMPIHTATLKLWATGSGKSKKPEMINAAMVKSGRQPQDDNEADAILLALYAGEQV